MHFWRIPDAMQFPIGLQGLISRHKVEAVLGVCRLSGRDIVLLGASIFLGAAIALQSYIFVLLFIVPLIVLITISGVHIERHLRFIGWLGIFTLAVFILWPRYSYLRFGGLPGITPSRLILASWMVLWVSFWLKLPSFRQAVADWWRSSGILPWFLLLLLGWRIFANFFSDYPLQGIYLLANEILSLGLIFVMASSAFRNQKSLPRFVAVIGWIALATCAIGFIEYWQKRNIFAGILPVTEDYAAQALSVKVRDTGYRAQSTFDHPLTFAQFLVTVIPLALSLLVSSAVFRARIFWGGVLITAACGVLVTSTRSAIVVSVVSSFFLLGLLGFRQILARQVSLLGLLVTNLSLIVLTIGAFVASDFLVSMAAGRTAAEASSSSARLLMLQRSIPAVLDSPLVGHGTGRAAELVGIVGSGGILSVDSLPISLAVESGLVSLFAYFGLMLVAVIYSIRAMAGAKDGGCLAAGLAASLLAFFLTTLTLSLTGNLFVLAFLLAAVVALRREGDKA